MTAKGRENLDSCCKAWEQCPNCATFTWAYKAEALRQMGRHAESFEAQLKVPERLVLQ